MFLGGYDPVTDDLYEYDGSNSGWPVGWNGNHALMPYRYQLQWVGLAKRKVAADGDANYYGRAGLITPPRQIPGGTPAAQLPNYYTYRYPSMTFLGTNFAVGAMHFWDGNVTVRNRPVTANIWATPEIRFLMGDGAIETRANADFLGSYNQVSSVDVAMSDMGVFEYAGASPAVGPFMPTVRIDTYPFPLDGWLLERQGRAIACAIEPLGASSNKPNQSIFRAKFTTTGRELQVAEGDSGSVFVAVIDGAVHYVGHLTGVLNQVTPQGIGYVNVAANRTLPSAAYFASIGRSWPVVNQPIDYPHASQAAHVTLQADLATIKTRLGVT
ncbi:MAG: hypothetical protein PSV22_14325 [Pseudolabrys sp.]|nr:hypothetical protein [Pseudolabrys sp.]